MNGYKDEVNKKNSRDIIIVTIIIIVVIVVVSMSSRLLHNVSFYQTKESHLIDSNDSEKKVRKYLNEYLNKKYGINSTLTLKDKKGLGFCDIFMDGSCAHEKKIRNVYRYAFSGVDENNNKFIINYSNSNLNKGKIEETKIEDNYYTYKYFKNIKEIVPNYFDKFEMYYYVGDDNYSLMHGTPGKIWIAINGDNINKLIEMQRAIFKENDSYEIVYTSNSDAYDLLISNSSHIFSKTYYWEDSNILTGDNGYSTFTNYYKTSKKYYEVLESLDSNSDYAIVLSVDRNSDKVAYYIYSKEKN